MSASVLRFIDVTFSYTVPGDPVFRSLCIHFSKGWTGVVGPNGVGKSTLAKLAAGVLKPTTGSVVMGESSTAFYCEQETAAPPECAHEFISGEEPASGKLRSLLGIGADWPERWESLSHGERKRFQIGAALWKEPDILVLDEPLNHVDLRARRLIASSLQTFAGIGIVVSHDREFLDALCRSCLFMRPGSAILRRGGFSGGSEQLRLDDLAREKKYLDALERHRDLKKRAASLKRRETGRPGRLSKRNIARHDHDAKSRVDGARLTGKDAKGARRAKLLEARADTLGLEASSLYFKRRKTEGILFRGERSKRDCILRMEEQSITLGPAKRLLVPELEILPADRIAIIGDNGTGKSSLIRSIVPAIDLRPEQVVYIPQEIEAKQWEEVREKMSGLDGRRLGMMLTAFHRLGSEPERLILSESPSPGEKRKIMLGLGLLKTPSIIIMDEPTNHMDLPSMQCIEDALNQFDGALLLVSHDLSFINNTTNIRWEILSHGEESVLEVNRR